MTDKRQLKTVDGHADLHSEHGPKRGEHTGRAVNPTIKVADLAWLEFVKPDLNRAETFARDFGFVLPPASPTRCLCEGPCRAPPRW